MGSSNSLQGSKNIIIGNKNAILGNRNYVFTSGLSLPAKNTSPTKTGAAIPIAVSDTLVSDNWVG